MTKRDSERVKKSVLIRIKKPKLGNVVTSRKFRFRVRGKEQKVGSGKTDRFLTKLIEF